MSSRTGLVRRRCAAGGHRAVVVVLIAGLLGAALTGCAESGAERTSTREPARPTPTRTVTKAPPRPPARQPSTVLTGSVSDVVDGDTIKVVSRGFETVVRLVGIDTPETRRPGSAVQCFGPAASARTKRLLPVGESVRLESDPTQSLRDRYGRLLAYVYRHGGSGAGGSVNYALVAGGHAKVYVYGGVPFRYAAQYEAAEARARSKRLGLWGSPCLGDTSKPDRSAGAGGTRPKAVSSSGQSRPGSARCDPNYTGACVPPYPPDVDCSDLGGATVTVVGSDPHHLDGNGDGLGCG